MNEIDTTQSTSIWKKDLNLVFVYIVIFLAGVAIVSIMINILNNKVDEIMTGVQYPTETNQNN